MRTPGDWPSAAQMSVADGTAASFSALNSVPTAVVVLSMSGEGRHRQTLLDGGDLQLHVDCEGASGVSTMFSRLT
jgi:hypothetical protein